MTMYSERADWTTLAFPGSASQGRVRTVLTAIGLAVLVGTAHGQTAPVAAPPAAPAQVIAAPTGPGEPPRVPPFAGTLVNWDRSGEFTAMCTLEEGGKTTKVGARIIKHTYVYVVEREIIRQLGSSPGACDPAFSPDGSRLAVVTANGLWLYTPRLEDARELAATRLPETPTNEFDYTAFSKPRWSSDGLRIAFVVGNSGTAWVQVVDVKTTRIIYRSPEETYSFAWTSDPRIITIGSSNVRLP